MNGGILFSFRFFLGKQRWSQQGRKAVLSPRFEQEPNGFESLEREMVFVLMAVVLSTASRSFEYPQTSFFSSPPLNIFENTAKAFDFWPGQGGYSSEWQEAKIGSGFTGFLSSFDVDTKIPELSLPKQPRRESWDFSPCPRPLCVCLSVSCHRMRKVSPLSLSFSFKHTHTVE